MTKEEKILLTKVLCEQLPYGVQVEIEGYHNGILEGIDGDTISTDRGINYPLRLVKPYLRPMSSITEEEMEKLKKLRSGLLWRKDVLRDIVLDLWYSTDAFDYLNAKHFDIRGLIPIGLAIAAIGENNPYKEEGGTK